MKPQLLFISLEHWDDVWRRNQFLAVRMQKDFTVTFIGPVIPFWRFFQKRLARYQNIQLKHIIKFFPERFAWLNALTYSVQCPRATNVLWLNDHTKYFLLEKVRYTKSIYDITDDWTITTPAYIPMDRFLCQAVNTVLVCSQGLLQRRSKITKNIILVKNGININDYTFTKSQQKYFLYTGSLHEDRLDILLMIALAKKYPQERFLYVGPNFMREATNKKLAQYVNIELVGAKPYTQLSRYMSEAKALIVPHCQNAFVNSLDPIKQYEYLLTAVPVISTNVSGFNEWSGLFTIVERNEFTAAIEKAIHGKIKVATAARRKAARQCSWDMRYKQIQGIVCAKKS